MRLYTHILVFCAVFLSSCALTATSLKISQIDALSDNATNMGAFAGIERLADRQTPDDIKRVNVFYIHGIGWTEDPKNVALGRRFVSGVSEAYKYDLSGPRFAPKCSKLETDGGDEITNPASIEITTAPVIYETIIPGAQLRVEKLVCMDRLIFRPVDDLEFTVYRVFWDDIFWDQIQEAHVGQDWDNEETLTIADTRKKYNRKLKDEMVNFGFSDAVMYLGPAGREIRLAVTGAMCAALLDASGTTFEIQDNSISAQKACSAIKHQPIATNQFVFVSESLGSKIMFDVMRDIMTDETTNNLDKMIVGTELYMMANQIALLSLSELNRGEAMLPAKFGASERPRIIALTEINDSLSYEINPFFENLWSQQYWSPDQPKREFDIPAREALSQHLGFDFVDVRVEFADPMLGVLTGLANPLQAHKDHMKEKGISKLILCGAENGKRNDLGCLAVQTGK
ncbi:MAG: hypothetical protein HKN36_14195 [Hellea sp.]|nr:hypothetical protein [Hellea sp.]